MRGKLAGSGLALGVPILAVVCCVSLPLLLAAGAGAALAVWVGSVIGGTVVLVALVALLAARLRR